MDVQCGMCGDEITVPDDAAKGIMCDPCQDYTMGYIYPEPVMAEAPLYRGNVCSDYERWLKQRRTNVRHTT